MTKTEELKLLEQIESLILTAPADSYIATTFAGMGKVCRDNIIDDFGNCPVKDLEEARKRYYALELDAIGMHASISTKDAEIKALRADAEGMEKRIAELQKQVKEVEDERDALSDCVSGSNAIMDKTDGIIRQSLMKAYAKGAADCGDDRYGYINAVRELAKALGFTNEEMWNVEMYVRAIAETNEELVENMAMIELSSIREERDD